MASPSRGAALPSACGEGGLARSESSCFSKRFYLDTIKVLQDEKRLKVLCLQEEAAEAGHILLSRSKTLELRRTLVDWSSTDDWGTLWVKTATVRSENIVEGIANLRHG